MSRKLAILCLSLIVSGLRGEMPQPASTHIYQFVNGKWFDGTKFAPASFYTVDGKLTSKKPGRIDSVIDLSGKFIVPPYGEAHNHNIDGFKKVEDRILQYLNDGIFYVKNPNSIPRYTARMSGIINTPLSIDVIFSNGGLTASGGHPLELVRRNIALGIFSQEDAEGGMYFIIDNANDLKRKWETIIADRPDFIKTYLLYSEEYSKRKNDTSFFGWKGLDPAILPKIVRKAHLSGLRVSTHIETSKDFHNALVAGVDEINHLPGFRADSTVNFNVYSITEADAARAGRRGVVVVTTLAGTFGGSAAYQEKFNQLHKKNLELLKKNRVRIAIGSDSYRQTSLAEAMYLSQLRVFGNAELLRIWCQTTAEAIFPRRKIGRLKEGYEANFLVLDDDPIKDFANTQKIESRVKQGEFMNLVK